MHMVKFRKLIVAIAVFSCFGAIPVSANTVNDVALQESMVSEVLVEDIGLVDSGHEKQVYYTKANGIPMNRLNDFLPEVKEINASPKEETPNNAKQINIQEAKPEKVASNRFGNPVKRNLSYDPSIKLSESEKAGVVALGNYKLTFYCACSKCCGAYSNGYTATGTFATEGRTIAVDKRKIPLGSKVFIEGYGWFIAEDVGGAIKGNKIDIFKSTHQSCLQEGVKYANVYVVK